ncbi:MAG TPA: penicillin acylase family protein [Longimicrobiales bacterium]
MKAVAAAVILGLAGCTALGQRGAPPAGDRWEASVTITRDAFGIPTIDAADDAGIAYGIAYAMAEDGLPEIDALYAALGDSAAAMAEYRSESPAMQALWSACAAGLNRYVAKHPQEPRAVTHYEPWMVLAAAKRLELAQREKTSGGGDETLAWAAAPTVAAGPPVLLVSGRRVNPYEMTLRAADGWRFHGFGVLGLAWPAEGFGGVTAYAHAAPAVPADTSAASRSIPDGRLAQLYALSRAQDLPSFAAARAQRRMTAPTVFIDRTTAALFTAEGAPVPASSVAMHAGDRAAAAAAVLTTDRPWTLDDLGLAIFDRRVYGADADIAALVDEWEQVGALNPDRAASIDDAVQVLTAWDRTSRGSAPEMTLYAAYRRTLEIDSSGALPRFRALEKVVADGTLRELRPWEAVNHIVSPPVPGSPTLAIPVAGAPGRFGIMFAYDAQRAGQQYIWLAAAGTGTGRAVVSHGQSARAHSRHAFDQAALFATARLRPVEAR